MILKLSLMQ